MFSLVTANRRDTQFSPCRSRARTCTLRPSLDSFRRPRNSTMVLASPLIEAKLASTIYGAGQEAQNAYNLPGISMATRAG
jgi:hypothetical protein